ncbi:MAG: hypothetical protein AAGI10_08620 [Pseudomonadota bacterium]
MKQIEQASDLREFLTAQRLFVVHAVDGWVDPISHGKFDFFTCLGPIMVKERVASVVVRLGSPISNAMLQQRHLHVIVGDAPQLRPNLLHVAPAYIWGFWYVDERGINANSSLAQQTFDPEGVDQSAAEYFFNGVSSWMLENNISRLSQAERAPQALAPARSVVFCQEVESRDPQEHYLTTDQMIRNAARAAGGGIVYVKPHPMQSSGIRTRLERLASADPNIRISDASVHDLIGVSDWVITQNSAAGFEALMQKKKIITCGRADYHHATVVARSDEELRRALRDGAGCLDGFEYEKYFYWFLGQNCLEPQKEGFAEAFWNRMRDKCAI